MMILLRLLERVDPGLIVLGYVLSLLILAAGVLARLYRRWVA